MIDDKITDIQSFDW